MGWVSAVTWLLVAVAAAIVVVAAVISTGRLSVFLPPAHHWRQRDAESTLEPPGASDIE